MTEILARFEKAATLVGGAPVQQDDLGAALSFGPHLVAADGGADRIAALGFKADLIIGDMDSIRSAPGADVPVHHIAEQDSTDFEKCLLHVAAPLYLGLGFLGGRVDHTLAAMHVLIAHAEKRVILIGQEDICFAAPREITLDIAAGERVSVYPVLPCRAIESAGLRWPLDGLELRAGRQIGTSNASVADAVSMRFETPGVVIILPKRWLSAAIDALSC